MNSFIFGEYIPGSSPVHRMNPASKLLLCVLFIIMTLISSHWIDYAELSILIIISFVMCHISFQVIYRGIKPLLLIILFTAILQLFFDPAGKLIWGLGPIKITEGGLSSSAFVFCRFLLIILISTLLTLSTPPTKLANGIRVILNPFRKLKLPVDIISLMISVALRFIPTLYKELRTIIKAQRSRGMIFRSGSLSDRVKKMAMLIIPLLFSSFEQARKLSYAMLSRGYQTNIRRTQINESSFTKLDGIAWAIYLFFGALEIMSKG
ncbi:energy-coupling factor transporter transmembrane component T family protein [Acetilactobacillus jinshanensis]|uniref:Energy-coupling factor transporter transmembrane protein EcfT n=1 Tax=Acetilactobacillus jinshanensis TaxID=1720083 RepID=A0A4P6ZJY9_9LACO|nr:energy-coupling factor transporter transmembrane component T [Acetilactobacillus jinshanensis]QBP17853.1 energy-coupling factor transporter transmembrane protein EcfT [Acetilactobacillus jinshanensis]URL60714.1 energy-coupling factor transporter transmembrane protein EcfT [uncultured bacterium]